MTEIVQGLFGVSPEQLQMQQNQALQARAMQYAQMSPQEQATAGIYTGVSKLGSALGGMLGGVDPVQQQASKIASVLQGADQTTAEGMMNIAKRFADAGLPQQYQMAIDKAQAMKQSEATLSQTQAKTAQEAAAARAAQYKIDQDEELRTKLASLPADVSQEELMKVGDAFADLIPDLSSFAMGGETASQTLTRLYSSLQVANNAFGQLIGTMFQASLSGASLASTLIQAFGSVDAFNSSMAFFTENFYSEAEQVTMASDRITAAFNALGLAAPATAAAFRSLVESLMRDVTAGVAGAAGTLAGVLATQQDVIKVDTYKAQQEAARQAARQAAAQAAAQRAQQAQQEAAQRAEKIAQERYNLESQLLQLQGNTAELRRRELNLLDPTNRALQEMIWKLEDAKDAMENISEVDFATKVDFLRAVGLARNNIPGFAAGGMFNGGPRIVGENGPELEVTGPSRIYSNRDTANMFRDPELAASVDGLRREVSGMRSEQLQIQVEISKNVKRMYDIERKWDTDGLPPERV